MLKQYLIYLLLSCNALKLNYSKELEAWNPLSSEEQTLLLSAKEDNVDNSWGEDSEVNIFDGIRFGLNTTANNIRTRVKNAINHFSTESPSVNSTLQQRYGIFGLKRTPLKRLRVRMRKRRKNITSTESDEPLKVVVPYEPIKILDTGFDIIGTVTEPIKMINMTTNNTNLVSMGNT